MKYLVMHSFRSYGRTLHKGEVVDESAIRSPRLRRSEGNIIPAVEEPLEKAPEIPAAPEAPDKESAVISSGAPAGQVVAAPGQEGAPSKEESRSPVRLSFGS